MLVATHHDADGEPDEWAYVAVEVADTYRREGWSSAPGGDPQAEDYWSSEFEQPI
ncbi:hypothetical protein NKG05_26085 [Oerskovia sp. M15]